MSVTKHEVFEWPKDTDASAWRYLDLPKYLSMLDSQALFFCRLDKLGDPFEGSLPRANIAAEIGTMRVTEQVDALETLAYDPLSFLVVPRVIAGTLMFPVVTSLAVAGGVVSGWIAAINLLDLTSPEFFKGLRMFYEGRDIWFGLVKSASFGTAITLAGCLMGLKATGGAEGVGNVTMKAVVLGAMSILVLDAFWALVLLK